MKKKITLLEKEDISLEEFNEYLKIIEEDGNVFILKVDGERRKEERNMVMITFPNSNKEMIRFDEANLNVAILKALRSYFYLSGASRTGGSL